MIAARDIYGGFRPPARPSRHQVSNALQVASGTLLAMAACAGLVVGGMVGLAAIRSSQVMVITSGSMEPSIPVGAAVFVTH